MFNETLFDVFTNGTVTVILFKDDEYILESIVSKLTLFSACQGVSAAAGLNKL